MGYVTRRHLVFFFAGLPANLTVHAEHRRAIGLPGEGMTMWHCSSGSCIGSRWDSGLSTSWQFLSTAVSIAWHCHTSPTIFSAYLDFRRRLRLSSTLVVPSTRLFTIYDHAIPVTHVWNTLPTEVTSSASIPAFKRQLDIIVRMELPQQLWTSLTLFLLCCLNVLLVFWFWFFVGCPSSHFDIAPP